MAKQTTPLKRRDCSGIQARSTTSKLPLHTELVSAQGLISPRYMIHIFGLISREKNIGAGVHSLRRIYFARSKSQSLVL